MSLRRHTVYNLAGTLLPLGLSLLTIPSYIGILGEARYGVLAIAWLILGYFGLFDLGLGRATAQSIAALSQSPAQKRASVFWTGLAGNVSLGVIGGVVLWLVATLFLARMLSVEAALQQELLDSLPWLALAVPLVTASGVLTGALEGRSRFLELNIISVLNAAMIQLIPLGVAWFYSPALSDVLPSVVCARLVSIAVLAGCCHVHVTAGQQIGVSWADGRRLLTFGGWVTVTSIIGPMMTILDRFVLGFVLGPKAVTYYTVPFQLAERTTILARSLSSSLFPRLAQLNSSEGKALSANALRTLSAITMPLMALAIFGIQPFLSVWLGTDFALQSALAGPVLLLGFWLNGMAAIPFAQLQAAGRPHLVAKCHLAEVLPYFVLLYLGMQWYGLVGAAVAFALRTCIDSLLLAHFAGILPQAGRTVVAPALLLLTAVFCVAVFNVGSPSWWIAFVAIEVLCLVLLWTNLRGLKGAKLAWYQRRLALLRKS